MMMVSPTSINFSVNSHINGSVESKDALKGIKSRPNEDSAYKKDSIYMDAFSKNSLTGGYSDKKSIYDLLKIKINKEPFEITIPKQFKRLLMYIVLAPHTHLQYLTIPNPMRRDKNNFYPVTLVFSMVWIWFYTFLIVWWTWKLSEAFSIHYSIIPMVFYPLGISIRDRKKFVDFKIAADIFKEELSDHEISLAETYSAPIFQITGLVGFSWFFFIVSTGKAITFKNEGIQYQAPLLLSCIFFKFILLLLNKFKTKKIMFFHNIINYLVFLVAVILIDYNQDL
jgi:sodium/potassium/calcium exchanger 2